MPASWEDRYPSFISDPHAPLQEEFTRLARHRQWKVNSKRYRKEWRLCIVEEFGAHYGSDESKLEGWRSLCAEVGIGEIPASITGCKKVSNP